MIPGGPPPAPEVGDRLARRVSTRVAAWPVWFAPVLVTAFLLLVYLPTTVTTHETNYSDTSSTYLAAAQLARDGTLTLEEGFADAPWVVETAEGRHVSNRFPGTIFYAAAFYAVMGAGSGEVVPTAPAALAAAVAAALAMGLLCLVLRRLVSPQAALAGALVGGLATSTWAISGHALWSHGPAQLVLVGSLLALGTGLHARSGLLMGASILVRPHLAVVPAVVGLHAGWARRRWRPVVAIGVTAALGLAAYLVYNHLVFGAGVTPGGGEQALPQISGGYGGNWLDNVLTLPPWEWLAAIAGALVAPSRGLLTISPFLLALAPGLPVAWRRAPVWVRGAALGGLVYVLLQLRANPAFGAGFGFVVYRIQLETLTLAAPLLALAWQHWTRLTALRRRVFWTLVGVSVAVQALAVSVDLPPSPPPLGGQIGWGLTEWRWVWDMLGWWVPVGLLAGAAAGFVVGSASGRVGEGADDRR